MKSILGHIGHSLGQSMWILGQCKYKECMLFIKTEMP